MIFKKTTSCPSFLKTRGEKSRRDGPEFNSGLLTVGFNLRTRSAVYSLKSPAGTTFYLSKMSSLRDLLRRWSFSFRRLKPTVNNPELNSGSSLRDFSPLVLRKEGHEVVFLKIITDYLFYVP